MELCNKALRHGIGPGDKALLMLKLHSWARITAIRGCGASPKSGSYEATETNNQFKAGEVWAGTSLAYTSNTRKRLNNLDLLL